MTDISSVLGAVSKRVEAAPFYVWNIFGIGLFVLYVKSGYSISSLSSQYPIEITILVSVLLSSIVQIVLMTVVGAVKRFHNAPDLELHQEFVLAGLISLSGALLLYSTHSLPMEIFTLLSGLFLLFVCAFILFLN